MLWQSAIPIVLDSSVLLNFVKIGQLGLLGQIGTRVVLLDQVFDEVLRPEQREAVEDAVATGILNFQSVRNPVEVDLFAELWAEGRGATWSGRMRCLSSRSHARLDCRASRPEGAN